MNAKAIGFVGMVVVLIGGLVAMLFMYQGKAKDLTAAEQTVEDSGQEIARLSSEADNLEATVSEKDVELTSLRASKAELESTKQSLEQDKRNLEQDKADLQTSLAGAESRASSLESQLSGAEASLASTAAEVSSLQSSLNTVMYPRHFESVQELTDWLAADDTDTRTEYANHSFGELAFVLQTRALQDGFVLGAHAYWDDQIWGLNGYCMAYIGNYSYFVFGEDDSVTGYELIRSYLPTYPVLQPN